MMSEFTSQGLANTSSLVKGEPLGGGNRDILTCLLNKKVFISNLLQKCNGHFHLYSFDYLAIFEAC